jgi:hypothetical protein
MGGAPGVPFAIGDWWQVITQVILFQHPFVWVHFLTLYALFLAMSPIAIFLLRKNKAWLLIVLSLIILAVGWHTHIEALQWQALFFIPSVAGYYLEPIRSRWQALSPSKRSLYSALIVGTTAITIAMSVVTTFYPESIQSISYTLNSMFAKDTISMWRLALASVWFTGFLLVFNRFRRWIGSKLGWLLIPIGTRSLTAYILHGIAIVIISYFTIASDNVVINTILGVVAILIVWALLRVPLIKKIIPR